jgi:hypothetical protein
MPRSDRSDADRVPNSQDDEDEDDDVLPVPYDFLNTRHGPVPDTETAVHIIHSARDHLFEIQLAAKKSTKKKRSKPVLTLSRYGSLWWQE